MHSLTVEGLPGELPTAIEHDVVALVLGDQLHVGDLQLPAGVDVTNEADELVAMISVPRGLAEGEGEVAAGRGRRGCRGRPRAPRARRRRPRTPARPSRVRSTRVARGDASRRPSARARRPTCLVVGLGNPGDGVPPHTKHNVGAEVVELLAPRTAAG